jgi:hypothetical protein
VATLLEIQSELAAQIDDVLDDTTIQVVGKLVWQPTPPCIDIYPADPFQEQQGFGVGRDTIYLSVRGRVNTPDHDGAQELLLSLMDPKAATSVQQAIESDQTLNGSVTQAMISEGPTNYGIFPDPSGQGAYLGCTWTVRVVL